MEITTPSEDGPPITKQVRVGGGVKLRVEGHRTTLWVKVLEIKSDEVLVVDFQNSPQTVGAFGIIDAMDKQQFEYQAIIDSQPDPGAG